MQAWIFLGGALVLSWLLNQVLGIGVFGGIWGFWISVILLSWLTAWISTRWIARRKLASRTLELSHVDSPHNQGKLGSLQLASGRPRLALQALERAALGEPDVAEWRFRLGSALRACGRHERAAAELEQALRLSPTHAYGEAAIELALARRSLGDAAGALAALEACERDHGETVRTAYLRGTLLARLSRREEARAAFRQVGAIAHRSPKFHRRGTLRWRARAWVAGLR